MESNTQLQQAGPALPSYDLVNSSSMLALATELKKFILDQRLYTPIQGRNYVNVEGWQFAGGMLGVLPIIKGTTNLSSDKELKYSASCELINIQTGAKVGGGFATCSNQEKGKKYFDEYAIESMAQTRCIGKAYRLMIGWLMKAAGYEATPAEEMDALAGTLEYAVREMLLCKNRECTNKVWKKYPQYQDEDSFVHAAKAMAAMYPKKEVEHAG